MQVNHGGELRFDTNSDDYTTILKWIRSGAPYGQEGEKEDVTVERVEALPREVVLDLEGVQQLLVMAYLSDGRYEDVSREVEYISKDPDVVMVTEEGEGDRGWERGDDGDDPGGGPRRECGYWSRRRK